MAEVEADLESGHARFLGVSDSRLESIATARGSNDLTNSSPNKLSTFSANQIENFVKYFDFHDFSILAVIECKLYAPLQIIFG